MSIVLTPGSPEWSKRVTASKVAAILGVSPWASQRSVWHQMRGELPREESNEQQRRGHYLEPAILAWWRDQHPEFGICNEQPTYELGDWAAATPDMVAIAGKEARENALVEAKSVAYDDEWGDPGTDVIPAYYLVQVYWQMHVSGVHRCYVPIITSRLRFAEYVVDYDPAIGADLEARMKAFYDSLIADEPPPLDDSVATYSAIRKIHPEIDAGQTVELDKSEAVDLVLCAAELKTAEAADRLCRSTVLDQIGRAQYATHNGLRVARRQANKYGVSLVVTAKPHDLTEGIAS